MSEVSTPVNRANRYAHIDGLRAFAVMLVVIAHAGLGHVIPGGSGVTIFFVVSGFIITHLILRERDKSGGFAVGRFYFRRAVKVFPPFALIVILPTLIWSIFNPIKWTDFLSQIFFTYNWSYLQFGSEGVLPGSAVVWSLAIEEQFYIVFAVIWLLLVRQRWWRLGVIVLGTAAVAYSNVARVLLIDGLNPETRIYYGTDTRMDGLAIGVLTAIVVHAWVSAGSKSTWYSRIIGHDSALVIAVLLYLLSLILRDEVFRYTGRFVMQALAAALVIAYGMFPSPGPLKRALQRITIWRPVALIGLSSYSIYLVHLVLNSALGGYITEWPAIVRVSVLIVLGVALGIGVYYLVETPAQRWRDMLTARRESATSTAWLKSGDQIRQRSNNAD